MNEFLFPRTHLPGIKADILGSIGNWPISDTVTFMMFMTVIFILVTIWLRSFKEVPGFFQSFFELFIESVENLLKSLTGGKNHRVKELIFPIVSIFLIIGSINIIGSLPIITEFTWSENGHLVPFFRKATADINVTLPLALVIVFSMQIFGVRNWGLVGYFKRFFPIDKWIQETKHGGVAGFFLGFIEMFIALIELASEFIKVISLSLRLFGNMFAGEIVLSILMGAFAVFIPALWMGFELMIAVIQALVFGCLTAVYYVMVIKEEGQSGH